VKIRNVDRLKRKLASLPIAARQEMRAALEKSAAEIVDLQRRFVPVKSGTLRKSIGYTFGDYAAQNANVRGVSGSSGTSKDKDLSVTVHGAARQPRQVCRITAPGQPGRAVLLSRLAARQEAGEGAHRPGGKQGSAEGGLE